MSRRGRVVEQGNIMCGRPYDLFKSVTLEGGKIVKFCPECENLKHIFKKCCNCENEFTPGCNIRNTCGTCYSINKYREADGL